MNITKIIAIRDRLNKRVSYAVNEEKTTLAAGITGICSANKKCFPAFANLPSLLLQYSKMTGRVWICGKSWRSRRKN